MSLPIFQRTIVSEQGDVVNGASVEIRRESDNSLAVIYSDRAGATLKTNPIVTGANGLAEFYAAPGEYRITATIGGDQVTWRWVAMGVPDGSITAAKLAPNSITAAKLAPNSITLLNWSNTNGQLAGTRNLLINANFQTPLNQRGYVSGTNTTGANQFTFDRWFIPTSGQKLTFTASGNGNSVTAPASGITQVIEGINIAGGNYCINWTGTATCTVNGTARTKGGTFTLLAGVNCVVRFSGGTLSQPQLEPGQFVTPFEHREIGDELRRCQRYYQSTNYTIGGAQVFAGQFLYFNMSLLVAMRAAPAMALVPGTASGAMNGQPSTFSVSSTNVSIGTASFSALNANGTYSGAYNLSSELTS